MFAFLVRRVLLLSAVVVGLSFGAFALVYGFVYDEDYVLQCGFTCENDFFYQEVYERAVARVAEQEGFNRPMVVQFADYLCGGLCIPNARRDGVIRGDFGRHWWLGRDLSFHLGITLPISAQLGFAALVVLYAIGIPLGVLGAAKRGTWIDTWLSVACTVVKSVPVFFLAPAVLIVVVLRLEIIEPPFGWEGLFRANSILHVGLMALVAMPLVVRTTRAGVIDALNQDYVRTARAKGLPERMVLRRHVMRNALTPLVDGVPPTLAALLTGLLVVEFVFGIGGFGRLFIVSFPDKEWEMVLAGIVLGLAAWAVCSLAADLLHWALDPRIRHDGAVSRSRTAGRALAV